MPQIPDDEVRKLVSEWKSLKSSVIPRQRNGLVALDQNRDQLNSFGAISTTLSIAAQERSLDYHGLDAVAVDPGGAKHAAWSEAATTVEKLDRLMAQPLAAEPAMAKPGGAPKVTVVGEVYPLHPGVFERRLREADTLDQFIELLDNCRDALRILLNEDAMPDLKWHLIRGMGLFDKPGLWSCRRVLAACRRADHFNLPHGTEPIGEISFEEELGWLNKLATAARALARPSAVLPSSLPQSAPTNIYQFNGPVTGGAGNQLAGPVHQTGSQYAAGHDAGTRRPAKEPTWRTRLKDNAWKIVTATIVLVAGLAIKHYWAKLFPEVPTHNAATQ